MTYLSRRSFVRGIVTYGSGAIFAPSLAGLAACGEAATPLSPGEPHALRRARKGAGAYGELAPSRECPEIWIPEGFSCVRLSETTHVSRANPSLTVPQALDGMAAFPLPNGRTRLIRNHEIRDPAATSRPIGTRPYDALAGGGTTSLEVVVHGAGSGRRVELVDEFVSLSGTHVNCAGGPTPWGTWLSCEETTEGRTRYADSRGRVLGGREMPHGYVFEVPATAAGEVEPVPLTAMGRFVHEAVAVDPRTDIVYLTEDFSYDPATPAERPGSGFYRFLPARRGALREGGRLQMLAVKARAGYDTTRGQRAATILPVTWVDIDDADPAAAETDPSAVFRQGLAAGGAIFQRLEGCWYGDGSVFFNATSGGDAGAGQVWQYRPLGASGGQLILVFESPSPEVLDSPDNLCVSPRGGLVLCEDGDGEQYVRGLTQRGEIFDLVRAPHDVGERGPTEFAGACFSPDGEVLFFNSQGSTSSTGTAVGVTYALWGPWEDGAL